MFSSDPDLGDGKDDDDDQWSTFPGILSKKQVHPLTKNVTKDKVECLRELGILKSFVHLILSVLVDERIESLENFSDDDGVYLSLLFLLFDRSEYVNPKSFFVIYSLFYEIIKQKKIHEIGMYEYRLLSLLQQADLSDIKNRTLLSQMFVQCFRKYELQADMFNLSSTKRKHKLKTSFCSVILRKIEQSKHQKGIKKIIQKISKKLEDCKVLSDIIMNHLSPNNEFQRNLSRIGGRVEEVDLEKLFTDLFHQRNESSNLEVFGIPNKNDGDKIISVAHKQILILNSRFFRNSIHLGTTGIEIRGIETKKEMDSVLEFCYVLRISDDQPQLSFSEFLNILYFSVESFREESLTDYLIDVYSSRIYSKNELELVKQIKRTFLHFKRVFSSYSFERRKKLKKSLKNVWAKVIKDEKYLESIMGYYELKVTQVKKNFVFEKIEKMKMIVQSQKQEHERKRNEIVDLTREIERLKSENEGLKKSQMSSQPVITNLKSESRASHSLERKVQTLERRSEMYRENASKLQTRIQEIQKSTRTIPSILRHVQTVQEIEDIERQIHRRKKDLEYKEEKERKEKELKEREKLEQILVRSEKLSFFSFDPKITSETIRSTENPSKILTLTQYFGLRNVLGFSFRECIFRASEHEFRGMMFHKLCDSCEQTIVIIKTDSDYVLGGYNPQKWYDGRGGFCDSKGSLIFGFQKSVVVSHPVSNDEDQTVIIINYNENGKGIHNSKGYGPSFGNHCIRISGMKECNRRAYSMTKLSSKGGYPCPEGKNPAFLNGGKSSFRVVEYEVFKKEEKNVISMIDD